ncbi:MAG: hypothetical protein KatS3mg105_1449 [Gemmatales bacterium]|nr:MAG: hypothetical protein KatS3mg105_1449 [Gemmatales bacterium]
MYHLIHCPECFRKLRIPEEWLGAKVQCPSCGSMFTSERQQVVSEGVEDFDQPAATSRDQNTHQQSTGYPAQSFGSHQPLRHPSKPSKVQAIGGMMLAGGIVAILASMAFMATCSCLLWPGTYYSLVLGILAVVRASSLLSEEAYQQSPPTGIAVMQIINIINCDLVNLILGILSLTFLNDPECQRYFRG